MNIERMRAVVSARSRALGQVLWMATAPLATTVVGIPFAAAAFTTGWMLQFVGRPTPPGADAYEVDDVLDEATAQLLG